MTRNRAGTVTAVLAALACAGCIVVPTPDHRHLGGHAEVTDATIDTFTLRLPDRAVKMVSQGTVTTHDGATIDIPVHSLCVHGDSPGAVRMATSVRAALETAGWPIASPVVCP